MLEDIRLQKLKRRRELRQKFKERDNIKSKERHAKNKERNNKKHREYMLANKDKLNEKRRAYAAKKKQEDVLFYCKYKIRNRLYQFLQERQYKKQNKTEEILGCSWQDTRIYLENTWAKNYPGEALDWKKVHLDHIIPLATAKTEEDVLRLNHHTNLQLLKAADNLRKRDSLTFSLI